MIGGREHHVFTLGEDHGLQHVRQLGDVCHVYAAGVLVEGVEGERGHHRIAHGILLVEEAGIRALFHVVPGAPFVHHQAHAPFRIVTIHDRAVFFQQFLDKGGFQDGIRVFFVREVRGVDPAARRALRRGVIVQGEPVHHPARFAHQRFRPIVIGARHARARAAGDLVYARTAVIAQIGLVAPVFIRVVRGGHVAAAAPVFVAHAEIGDFPGRFAAVLPPPVRHGGNAWIRQVFHPLAHFLHRAAAEVAVDIGLAADLAAQLQKFVRAKGIVLRHAAPVGVHHGFARGFGPHAVLPMVFVGKATARPAQNAQADVAQGLHHVGAHAVHVGDGRVLAHVYAAIDAAAQVLGKVAVDFRMDVREFQLGHHQDSHGMTSSTNGSIEWDRLR